MSVPPRPRTLPRPYLKSAALFKPAAKFGVFHYRLKPFVGVFAEDFLRQIGKIDMPACFPADTPPQLVKPGKPSLSVS